MRFGNIRSIKLVTKCIYTFDGGERMNVKKYRMTEQTTTRKQMQISLPFSGISISCKSHTLCVFASMSVDRWYYFYNTFINQVREFVNISTQKKLFLAMSGSLSRSINLLNWKCGIRVRVVVDVVRSCYFMLILSASKTGWSVCTLYSIQLNWSLLKFSFFIFHLKVALFFRRYSNSLLF